MKILEKIVNGFTKFKEDLEKESVSHGEHKPHCCTLPEDVLNKGEEARKDKEAA